MLFWLPVRVLCGVGDSIAVQSFYWMSYILVGSLETSSPGFEFRSSSRKKFVKYWGDCQFRFGSRLSLWCCGISRLNRRISCLARVKEVIIIGWRINRRGHKLRKKKISITKYLLLVQCTEIKYNMKCHHES